MPSAIGRSKAPPSFRKSAGGKRYKHEDYSAGLIQFALAEFIDGHNLNPLKITAEEICNFLKNDNHLPAQIRNGTALRHAFPRPQTFFGDGRAKLGALVARVRQDHGAALSSLSLTASMLSSAQRCLAHESRTI